VESVGASVNQFLDKLGNLGSGSPLLRQSLDLLGGRDFTSQKQPEQGLGKGLGSTRSSWELGLAFGDSLSSESNTLVGVQNGSFPNKTLDTPHTSVGLVDSHLAKALVAVSGSDSLDVFDFLGNELGHSVLERLGVGSLARGEGPRKGGSDLGIRGLSSQNCHLWW
jgi:hypothetical protein